MVMARLILGQHLLKLQILSLDVRMLKVVILVIELRLRRLHIWKGKALLMLRRRSRSLLAQAIVPRRAFKTRSVRIVQTVMHAKVLQLLDHQAVFLHDFVLVSHNCFGHFRAEVVELVVAELLITAALVDLGGLVG